MVRRAQLPAEDLREAQPCLSTMLPLEPLRYEVREHFLANGKLQGQRVRLARAPLRDRLPPGNIPPAVQYPLFALAAGVHAVEIATIYDIDPREIVLLLRLCPIPDWWPRSALHPQPLFSCPQGGNRARHREPAAA